MARKKIKTSPGEYTMRYQVPSDMLRLRLPGGVSTSVIDLGKPDARRMLGLSGRPRKSKEELLDDKAFVRRIEEEMKRAGTTKAAAIRAIMAEDRCSNDKQAYDKYRNRLNRAKKCS
jgi:hypothetical protein